MTITNLERTKGEGSKEDGEKKRGRLRSIKMSKRYTIV